MLAEHVECLVIFNTNHFWKNVLYGILRNFDVLHLAVSNRKNSFKCSFITIFLTAVIKLFPENWVILMDFDGNSKKESICFDWYFHYGYTIKSLQVWYQLFLRSGDSSCLINGFHNWDQQHQINWYGVSNNKKIIFKSNPVVFGIEKQMMPKALTINQSISPAIEHIDFFVH